MKLETIAPLQDLPDGEGYLWKSGALELAVFRRGDEVSAIENACPHAGASLCSGYADGTIVVCPWHGWEFEIATGKGLSVEGVDCEAFRVVVEDGVAKVELPN